MHGGWGERLDPEQFQQGFQSWVSSLAKLLGATVVSLDGKTHRGSYDREHQQSALQTVSAWASEHRLMRLADESRLQIQRDYCDSRPVGVTRHDLAASLPLMRWGHKERLPNKLSPHKPTTS